LGTWRGYHRGVEKRSEVWLWRDLNAKTRPVNSFLVDWEPLAGGMLLIIDFKLNMAILWKVG
jgi:hypothetical protein